MAREFDPISLEIMWSRLVSIANQGAASLLRTSFSTVVASAKDFRYLVTDAVGNSLAQSDQGEPVFVTTFPACIKKILRVLPPEQLEPGDVIITNDPWVAAGHLPDIHVATPVFHRGKLVAFTGSVIHISDIGGRFGSHDSSEVYEEGLCLPVLKLYKRGVPTEEIFQILTANVRAPDMQLGDVRAMVTGNEVGARLLVEFLREYDLEDLADISAEIQTRVEKGMRDAIRALPDGVYDHETWIDGFQDDIHIKSRITVNGDEMTVDYTGSSPQTMKSSVNCVLHCTYAGTLFPLKAILAPQIPNNEGAIRPITIIAPEGSILNATRPAPVDVRAMVMLNMPDHILGALAPIVPASVTAEMGTRWMLLADRSPRAGKRTITSFFQAGATGAAHHRDGSSGRFFPIGAAHTAVEVFERQTRLLVARKNLRVGSGGAGRFRGGCGQDLLIENVDETRVDFTFYRPRVRNPARGFFGGKMGGAGIIYHNGELLRKGVLSLEQGDLAVMLTPGGGGYGDPLTRDADRVLADVIDGYITAGQARDVYGVAVDPETHTIDWEETDALRGKQTPSPAVAR